MSSMPYSDFRWYQITAFTNFFKSFKKITISIKNMIGYNGELSKKGNIPPFQNFNGGGWGSIRGFRENSIGSIEKINKNSKDSIGGNLIIYSNLDIILTIPKINNRLNIKIGVFLDIGNIYSTYEILDNSEMLINSKIYPINFHCSIGIELIWISPFGPMAFSIAKPLNIKETDNIQPFQFTLGKIF